MGPMKESEQAVWRRPYPSRFAPVASHRARACTVFRRRRERRVDL